MRKKLNIEPPEEITSFEQAMIEQKREKGLNVIEQRRKYELITPLYGGGVTTDDDHTTTNKADPITIIRATEIRGQLRFWWRATRGWKFNGDPKAMKIEEDSIWGKAYQKNDKGIPSDQTVQIVIDVSQKGILIKPFGMNGTKPIPINGIPDYAAFPLKPDQKEQKKPYPYISDLWKEIHFTLNISYPSIFSKEIEAALWAWETFGGIGARTRRGFGALHLLAVEIDGDDIPCQPLSTPREIKQWIKDKIDEYIKQETFPSNFPHLSRKMQPVVIPSAKNPMQVWSNIITELKEFRLQKDMNKRSAWPEADAIRKFTGKETKNTPPSPQKFPRAAFGLPIIFHFTGKDIPDDYTLNEADTQDTNKKRFASPLILRPFLYRDNRAVGLALLLEGSRIDLDNLALEDKNKNVLLINGTSTLNGVLTADEARTLAQKSSNSYDGKDALWALKKETDVLEAFMNTLREIERR
jgi:CRISPR-associated protein Cmr1